MTRIRTCSLAWICAAAALGGCDRAPPKAAAPPPPTTGSDLPLPSFVGKAWVSVTLGHAPGTIKVFLPDKTVLMDSCSEGYRIEKWGVISADTIRWVEDAIPIQATWRQITPDSLQMKIIGRDIEERYVAASVPYVCSG